MKNLIDRIMEDPAAHATFWAVSAITFSYATYYSLNNSQKAEYAVLPFLASLTSGINAYLNINKTKKG